MNARQMQRLETVLARLELLARMVPRLRLDEHIFGKWLRIHQRLLDQLSRISPAVEVAG